MSLIHKKCNAEIKADTSRAIREGKSPGDWGYCTKCGKRVDHLLMKKGNVVLSDEVETMSEKNLELGL